MSLPTPPIDFNAVRAAIANEVQRVTRTTCVLEEAAYQGAPRPKLPYFSFKLLGPSGYYGYDSIRYTGTDTDFNVGGQRRLNVSFNCYGNDQEQAYGLMSLWQHSLGVPTTQERLRRAGVAVWDPGSVSDVSQLLNTGYEGRAHLDTVLGIASNLTADLGTIETTDVTGTVDTGDGEATIHFTAPEGD